MNVRLFVLAVLPENIQVKLHHRAVIVMLQKDTSACKHRASALFARPERGRTTLPIHARAALLENIQSEGRISALSVHQEADRVIQRRAARLASQAKFPSISSAPSAKRGNTHHLEMSRARHALVKEVNTVMK